MRKLTTFGWGTLALLTGSVNALTSCLTNNEQLLGISILVFGFTTTKLFMRILS